MQTVTPPPLPPAGFMNGLLWLLLAFQLQDILNDGWTKASSVQTLGSLNPEEGSIISHAEY